jgi:hypothetical protein
VCRVLLWSHSSLQCSRLESRLQAFGMGTLLCVPEINKSVLFSEVCHLNLFAFQGGNSDPIKLDRAGGGRRVISAPIHRTASCLVWI